LIDLIQTQRNYPNKKQVYQLFGILRIDRNLIPFISEQEVSKKKPLGFSSDLVSYDNIWRTALTEESGEPSTFM
jgi:hypothetical protein